MKSIIRIKYLFTLCFGIFFQITIFGNFYDASPIEASNVEETQALGVEYALRGHQEYAVVIKLVGASAGETYRVYQVWDNGHESVVSNTDGRFYFMEYTPEGAYGRPQYYASIGWGARNDIVVSDLSVDVQKSGSCQPGNVTLTASISSAANYGCYFRWYNSSHQLLQDGASTTYSTHVPSLTQFYVVAYHPTARCTGESTTVTVPASTPIVSISPDPQPIPGFGQGGTRKYTAIVTGYVGPNTYYTWKKDGNFVSNGTSYTLNLNQTTNQISVQVENEGCLSNIASVNIQVLYSIGPSVGQEANPPCGVTVNPSGYVTVYGSSPASDQEQYELYNFYQSENGSGIRSPNNSYNVQAGQTVWVSVYNSLYGYESPKTSYQVQPLTATPSPAEPMLEYAISCQQEYAKVKLTGAPAGGSYTFYQMLNEEEQNSSSNTNGLFNVLERGGYQYYASISKGGCESTKLPVTFRSLIAPSVTASAKDFFYAADITLTAQNQDPYLLENTQYIWGIPNKVLHTSTDNNFYTNVDVDRTFSVRIKDLGTGCESPSASVTVISHKMRVYQDQLCGYTELLTEGQGRYGYIYYWQSQPGGTDESHPITEPFYLSQNGTYYLRVRAEDKTWGSASEGIDVLIDNDPQCLNYIFKELVTVEGITSAEQLYNLTPEQVQRSYTYYDGLGRPKQSVAVSASFDQNDIVTPFVYDLFGREAVKYLPYEATTNDGFYKSNAVADQSTFYSNPPTGVIRDITPYTTPLYEPSPLNRPIGQYGAGNDWYGAGKKQTMAYRSNNANEILQWVATSSQVRAQAYYAAGKLYVTETTDEDDRSVIEYTDLQGRIVRSAQKADEGYAITDYAYDDFGRQAYVIPPAVDKTPQTIAVSANKTSTFARYIYAYRYDERGRVKRKHIPGAGWTSIVYNKLDLPVLTQDTVQQKDKKWVYIKYDAHGRVVSTGLFNPGEVLSYDTLRDRIYRAQQWETRPANNANYSNQAFPTANTTELTVNYYDNYGFVTGGGNYTGASGMIQGLPTGSKVRVVGSDEWLTTVIHYDDKGQVIHSKIDQLKISGSAVTDEITNEYDFTGRLLSSTRNHNNNATLVTSNRYDHVGRLVSVEQSIGGQTFPVANNTYNAVGQLIETSLHDGLEPVTYKYNIRGWLTEISSNNFKEKLHYFDAVSGLSTTAQWAGNISAMEWRADKLSADWNSYRFTYDVMSRMTNAYYKRKDGTATSYSSSSNTSKNDYYAVYLGYKDLMGNLDWLTRMAGTTDIDDIVYFYDNGNQVSRVREYATSAQNALGFKDNLKNNTTYYTYDNAGRLSKDNNLGVDFTYNHMSLVQLAKKGTDSLKYTYDGTGRRVKKQLKTNTPRYYIDGIEYEGNQLKFISTPYGRIRKTTTGWTYDYFLKDHLGNVRVVFAAEPGSTSGSSTQVYMATMEAPSGSPQGGEMGTDESLYFDNLENTRADKPLNYPDKNPLNQKLSKVPGKSRGPSIMLQVMAGDTIEISAKAFYNIDKAMPGVTPDIAPVLGSAIAAMSNPTNVIVGEASQLAMDLGATPSTSVALISPPSEGPGEADPTPEAGINFVLYNNSFEVVDENTGVIKLEDKINIIQNLTTDKIVIQQAGFFEIFINNEAQTPVYFDNLMVAHATADVLEVNAYYPFGMIIPQLSYLASAEKKNYYKYNAKELQEELELNWLDYGARVMTPAVGRFWVPDPLAENHYNLSPYVYALNNPIRFIDPFGLDTAYFDTQGNIVERIINDSPDVFFTRTNEVIPGSSETNYENYGTPQYITVDTEITMDSDIGTIARATYAEMRGKDSNSKAVVAESIVNRSALKVGSYENPDGTISGIVNKGYDVAKPTDAAHDSFINPQNHNNKNQNERKAWSDSMGAAVKAYNRNSNIGQGVIFYDSNNPTRMDNNPLVQKINLSVKASGIKGAWKLK